MRRAPTPETGPGVVAAIDAALGARRLVASGRRYRPAYAHAAVVVVVQVYALFRGDITAVLLCVAAAALSVLLCLPMIGQRRRLGPSRSRFEPVWVRQSAARPRAALGNALESSAPLLDEVAEHFAFEHERVERILDALASRFGPPRAIAALGLGLLHVLPGALILVRLGHAEIATAPIFAIGAASMLIGALALAWTVHGAEAVRDEVHAWRRVVHVIAALDTLTERAVARVEHSRAGRAAGDGSDRGWRADRRSGALIDDRRESD